MNAPRRQAIAALVLAAVALAPRAARSLPSPGSTRPELVLEDAWERAYRLPEQNGLPTLVVYEDKGSADLNRPLKDELSRLAQGERYRRTVALVAIADVEGYDYWPVRGFVKDAIRRESKRQGLVIYCDWDGRVRRRLALDAGTSNVVLFGRDGRVLFAASGAVPEAGRAAIVELLRREVEGDGRSGGG